MTDEQQTSHNDTTHGPRQQLQLGIDAKIGGAGPKDDADGLYLLKGGGKPVWKLFPRIKKDWRKPQGIIFGKRCGVTQDIGPAARESQVARLLINQ